MPKQNLSDIILGHEALHSTFERISETLFFGYVLDPRALHKRFIVEILFDGVPIKLLRAEQYDPGLRNRTFGDGCYAFEFAAKATWLHRHHTIEARVANSGVPLASAISLAAPLAPQRQAPIGAVVWDGGIRLSGWVRDDPNSQLSVRALEGETLLTESRLDRWVHVDSEEQLLSGRIGFELWLPEALADGTIHRIRVVARNDIELAGSPVSILAFPDGLVSFLAKTAIGTADKARLEFLEKLLPVSLPFSGFSEWQRRFPLPVTTNPAHGSTAVVLVGYGNADHSLASLATQPSHQPWTAVVLPPSDIIGDAFDPADLIHFLEHEGSDSSVVVFARCGATFAKEGLSRFYDTLMSNSEALLAYGDIAITSHDGHHWPAFFPAFDYERLLEQGYAANWFAVRRTTVLSIMSKRPTTLFRLFNATLDEGTSEVFDRILHLPGVSATVPMFDLPSSRIELAQATKAHLETTGVDATILPSAGTLFPAVRVCRRIKNGSRVAIIVPTRDRIDLLKPCIESLEPAAPEIDQELIIVDNDSCLDQTRDYLHQLASQGAKVLVQPGSFNFSRLINSAVALTSAEYVCLLNNDVQAIDPNWLSELLSRLADRTVGAVGAMLQWPNGVVQHGGVTLGPYFGAAHAFNDRIRDDPGYCDLLRVARECSALTAACLLLRRSDYLAVDGLDETIFPINFNDVDLCLKLRVRGYRIVFTPHTPLMHHGSASRGREQTAFDQERASRERAVLHARWGDTVANDPYYNPQLNLDATPYSGLAWPPRSYASRTRLPPVPAAIPAGF